MADSILDIKDILNEYSEDIQKGIDNATRNVSKKAKDELRRTSPRRTGAYAKGWTVNTTSGKGYINSTVWNPPEYRLTHLLENGHLKRNGGKVQPRVHIAPVEKEAVKEYQRDVENVIKNGG